MYSVLLGKSLTVLAALSLSAVVVGASVSPSSRVCDYNLSRLEEYADLHGGTLENRRMDDDALMHCVVAIDGAMRDPRDIVALTEEQLNAHPIERRAMLALSSSNPIQRIHFGRSVSLVRIRDSVFTMKTHCLVEDLG